MTESSYIKKSELRRKLVGETVKQHRGGTAGLKGYRYQDYIVVFELLSGGYRASEDGSRWSELYKQEVIDSFTDDLHVLLHDRRHVQIKSKDGLSWEEALRDQFRKERELYPDAVLELCVHNPGLKESLDNNKEKWGLGDVIVKCLPITEMRRPYQFSHIQKMIKSFLRPPHNINRYRRFWYHLYGTWIHEFEGAANLIEYFDHCSATHEGGMKAASIESEEVRSAICRWNLKQEALHFSADQVNLCVRIIGSEFGDLILPIDILPSGFWSIEVVNSPWQIPNAAQQFYDD